MKIQDEGTVRNKAIYVALNVRPDGRKEVRALWIEQTEGTKFWLRVMNDLKNRGVEDVLIALVDGLKGFPDAIMAAFPKTQIQTCVAHLIWNSLALISYKDRRPVAAALKESTRQPAPMPARQPSTPLHRVSVAESNRRSRCPGASIGRS